MVEMVILILVLIAAFGIYLLPFAAGIYMERRDRRRRGEPDPERARYDERQRLIRLEAGTHALYATEGFLAVWLILEAIGVLDAWPGRSLPLLGCGLLLPLMVWDGECILRGAHLGFNQSKNESGQIARYFLMGVCWTLIGVTSLNLSPVQLLLGVNYLVEGVLMWYVRRRRERAEERLDAEDSVG